MTELWPWSYKGNKSQFPNKQVAILKEHDLEIPAVGMFTSIRLHWGRAAPEELVPTGEERGKANAVVLSLSCTLELPGKLIYVYIHTHSDAWALGAPMEWIWGIDWA